MYNPNDTYYCCDCGESGDENHFEEDMIEGDQICPSCNSTDIDEYPD